VKPASTPANCLEVRGNAVAVGDGRSSARKACRAPRSSNDSVGDACDPLTYAFRGFLEPVDNPPTINSATAGKAIPIKLGLSGDQGLDVLASSYPASERVSCDSNVPVDQLEQTDTAGSSRLSYDPVSDQYSYVWKTDKVWAGTCRVFASS
jgi:hypothetical protein